MTVGHVNSSAESYKMAANSQNKSCCRAFYGRRLRLLVLLCLWWSCCGCSYSVQAHQLYTMGTQKLCGQALTDAMEVVCVKGYNGKPLPRLTKKRMEAATARMQDRAGSVDLDLLEQSSHVEQEQSNAYALSSLLSNIYGREVLIKTLRRQRRQGGGVYDECCRNSCSYTELAAYCRQR